MRLAENHHNRKFLLVSLGCAKNLVDSESLMYNLCNKGFSPCEREEDADVVIINTCCFIEPAKEESIETIFEFALKKKKHSFKIIVCGCLSQRFAGELPALIPEVDAWCGIEEFEKLPDIAKSTIEGNKITSIEKPPDFYREIGGRIPVTPGSWSYIKIAEGCNHSCSFCIIPSIKGKYRSRTIEAITREAKELAGRGGGELILIAQDTASYGEDIYGKKSLPRLLEVLEEIEGIKWLRILYAYPHSIDDSLIETIARSSKIVPYLDIPFQHCNERILNMMGRFPSPGYRSLISSLRNAIPGLAIRSSFIIGFPGETEEEFEELISFLEESRFERAGFFLYSQEEGTAAARFERQVSQSKKIKRMSKATNVQKRISLSLHREKEHSIVPVIVDKVRKRRGSWKGILKELGNFYGERIEEEEIAYLGRSSWDAPEIDGTVLIKKNRNVRNIGEGDIINVRITGVSAYDVAGYPIS